MINLKKWTVGNSSHARNSRQWLTGSARCQVREYWIIDPVRKSVEQYQLDEPTMAFASVAVFYNDDTLTAITVPDFRIPVSAIFDKKVNMATLQAIITQ